MFIRTIAWTAACALQFATPGDAPQQFVPSRGAEPADATDALHEKTFSDERLDQIVAPIALLPDALLAQVMMAATYPLEVVEAARFMQAHPGLAGSKVEEALKDRDWDASVKSLCGFPDLLQRMNDNLGWMRDLGDASLAQRAETMDAVQRMRRRAIDAGNLKTSAEMTVTDSSAKIVTIAPPVTEVVYVPTYYPTCVYSGWYADYWWYPALFVPPPPVGPYFYFGVGVPWGFGLYSHCDWGWHQSRIEVDVVAHDRFVQRTFVDPRPVLLSTGGGRAGVVAWQHDPAHRRGVNYRSPTIAQQFRAANVRATPWGERDLRGRTPPVLPPQGRTAPGPRPPPQRPPHDDPRPHDKPRGDGRDGHDGRDA
jgi:hypothetical protein